MRGNLAPAAIVLHVVQETECLLSEYGGKLLLFLDAFLVKDSAKLVQCVRCVTAEGRDVLRGILTDVDCSCGGNGFLTAVSVSDDGCGEGRASSPMVLYSINILYTISRIKNLNFPLLIKIE